MKIKYWVLIITFILFAVTEAQAQLVGASISPNDGTVVLDPADPEEYTAIGGYSIINNTAGVLGYRAVLEVFEPGAGGSPTHRKVKLGTLLPNQSVNSVVGSIIEEYNQLGYYIFNCIVELDTGPNGDLEVWASKGSLVECVEEGSGP